MHEVCIEISEVRLVLGMSDMVWLVVLDMSDDDTKVEPWTKKLRQVSDYQFIRSSNYETKKMRN